MRIAGLTLQWLDIEDINILRWGEHQRVFAIRDFVVIKCGRAAQAIPRLIGQGGGCSMVGMIVDRPMGEDDIGIQAGEKLGEVTVVCAIDNCVAVALRRKGRCRAKNATGFLGLPDACAVFGSGAADTLWLRGFTAIEIQERDLVPEPPITSDGPSAAVFWITGVATCHHHVQCAARRGSA